jgi:hypothetical protein
MQSEWYMLASSKSLKIKYEAIEKHWETNNQKQNYCRLEASRKAMAKSDEAWLAF